MTNLVFDEKKFKADVAIAVCDASLNLLYLDSCESTNIECLKLSTNNSIVIAEMQTAGRGRRGNEWHSPSSQNIYCSIGLNKSIQAEYLGLISLLVGVCIVTVLRQQGIEDVGLKWPNDILLQGKKLGGILIETRVNREDDFYLVIGFGLNVNLTESEHEIIGQPAISLNQLAHTKIDRNQLLTDLVTHIMQTVKSFDSRSIEPLLKTFNQYDCYKNMDIIVKTRTEEITGRTLGIEDTGWIRVQTSDGIKSFSAAEISLRKQVN